MMSEEQFRPSNAQQSNGPNEEDDDDDKIRGQNNKIVEITSNTSSAPPVRRSRFFRSKRKKNLFNEQTNQTVNNNNNNNNDDDDDDDDNENNVVLNTTVTIQRTIEEKFDENISTSDINTTPIEESTSRRSLLSPPPSPTLTDDTDETDASTASEDSPFSANFEDIAKERQIYLTRKHSCEKPVINEKKLSPPISFPGYERKKSQSVKLTHADRLDSYPKKNVRFADDFGLDLSQIKVIKSDELPNVPSTAFKDLHISCDDNNMSFYQERMKTITYLEQQFENPIHAQGFDDRVAHNKVALEQANAIDNRIYGTVKIISFGVNKRVKVRFTTDNWISYHDNSATYILDSYDGLHDRFTFTLDIDRDRLCVGNNIQFCIGYESFVGPEYWDSNYQQNYRFDCISRTIPDYNG